MLTKSDQTLGNKGYFEEMKSYQCRCVVTGRSRGVYRDFRVSRFIFRFEESSLWISFNFFFCRQEADYNRVSGVQRAHWTHNTKIDP